MKKKIVDISDKKVKELAYKVGADVVLGLEKKKFNFIPKWKNRTIKQQGKFSCFNCYAKIWMFY